MRARVLGILVSGGPAPGINSVIGAATIEAINNRFAVIGIYDGFSRLADAGFDPDKHTTPLTIGRVSRIHFSGGALLRTSRVNLIDEKTTSVSAKVQPDGIKLEQVLANLRMLGVTHLLTIGGDDTALSARFVDEAAGQALRVVHCPKTIDNDLPLPGDVKTFGFATARHLGAELTKHLMEDARCTSRWYIVVTMGRKAGFLALGIGKAAGATISLIPEEFPERTSIAQIADVLEGAIIKRLSHGRSDGVAVVAEGLAYRLGDVDELERLLERKIPLDAAGHPRLSEVPLARLLTDELTRRFKQRGAEQSFVAHTLGYEMRCAPPTPFEMDYCRDLGFGAVQLLRGSEETYPPGVMITYQNGNLVPMDFADMIDPVTGRTRIRQVDLQCDHYRVARAYMIRLERADLESPDRLGRLASAAGMSPEAFRQRFASAVFDLDDGTGSRTASHERVVA
ncbi:MAG: 6-phosphofructokinase [Phycisphaerae bacterium]